MQRLIAHQQLFRNALGEQSFLILLESATKCPAECSGKRGRIPPITRGDLFSSNRCAEIAAHLLHDGQKGLHRRGYTRQVVGHERRDGGQQLAAQEGPIPQCFPLRRIKDPLADLPARRQAAHLSRFRQRIAARKQFHMEVHIGLADMSVAPKVMRQAARDQIYPPRLKIQRAFFRADVPVSRQNIVNGVVHIADSAVIPRRISLKGQRANKAELNIFCHKITSFSTIITWAGITAQAILKLRSATAT